MAGNDEQRSSGKQDQIAGVDADVLAAWLGADETGKRPNVEEPKSAAAQPAPPPSPPAAAPAPPAPPVDPFAAATSTEPAAPSGSQPGSFPTPAPAGGTATPTSEPTPPAAPAEAQPGSFPVPGGPPQSKPLAPYPAPAPADQEPEAPASASVVDGPAAPSTPTMPPTPPAEPAPPPPEPADAAPDLSDFALDFLEDDLAPDIGGVTAPTATPASPETPAPVAPEPPPVPTPLAGATLSVEVTCGGRMTSVEISAEAMIGRPERGITPAIDMSADDAVSRRHGRIFREADSFQLEDLGSTNGTRLNGQAVTPGSAIPLNPGDRIELGEGSLIVVLGGPTPNG